MKTPDKIQVEVVPASTIYLVVSGDVTVILHSYIAPYQIEGPDGHRVSYRVKVSTPFQRVKDAYSRKVRIPAGELK